MRVLHVIQSLHPRNGGPPAVALRLAAAQARQGAHVGILSYQDESVDGAVERSTALVSDLSLVERTDLRSEQTRGARALAFNAGRWLEQNAKRWDVAHFHNVWDPVVRGGASAARRAGMPYVITPHGSLDPWALRQTWFKRLKKTIALWIQIRSLLNHALFLHVLNRDEERGMAGLRLASPCEVVANGISLEEMGSLPPPGSFRSHFPRIGQNPFVLFLSRLHFKKGLDILIEAFAPLARTSANLRLVIVGPDDGALGPMLRRATELGIESQIEVVGPLYGAEKYAALVDANVFCLPSRMEGFSIAILEAMACSCPVVISENCHFPEVADFNAGSVVALRPELFTMAIGALLDDPHRRHEAGQRGRGMVEQYFTWPKIARKLLDCYGRHMITRGRSPA
jgi:glycosyltransferase involved in cell wall biosynthesis